MSNSNSSFEYYPGLPYRDQLVKLIVGALVVEGGYNISAKRLDTESPEQLPEPFKWEYSITAFTSNKYTMRIETKNIGAGFSKIVVRRGHDDNSLRYVLDIPPHPTKLDLRRTAYAVLSICNRLGRDLNSSDKLDSHSTCNLGVGLHGTIYSKFTCSCSPCIPIDSIEKDVSMMMNKYREGTYE